MKKAYKIIACAAILTAVVGCRREMEFQTVPFANIYNESISVDENVGTITIPVSLSAIKGDKNTSVTFKVIEGKAKEGTNFTVEPSGKVLNFNGTDTQNITVNVIEQAGVFTGSLDFKIELVSATNDYTLGGTTATSVTIKDLDHPLANLFGTFSGAAPGYWGDKYTASVQILADPDDINKVLVYNLETYLADNGLTAPKYNVFTGTVNAEKNKITIPTGQKTGYVSSSQGPLYVVGFDAPSADDASDDYVDIVLNYSADYKTISVPNGYALRSSAGWWEIYLGPMTWTKK